MKNWKIFSYLSIAGQVSELHHLGAKLAEGFDELGKIWYALEASEAAGNLVLGE